MYILTYQAFSNARVEKNIQLNQQNFLSINTSNLATRPMKSNFKNPSNNRHNVIEIYWNGILATFATFFPALGRGLMVGPSNA